MNPEYNSNRQPASERTVYVDAHVHLYEPARRDDLLDAASANVARLAAADDRQPASGLLLLADPDGVDGFGWLSQLPDSGPSSTDATAWHVAGRPDGVTLHLRREGETPLTVIAGHQAITAEKLEVLIFPTLPQRTPSAPLSVTLDEAGEHGAVAILPWGAGKWLGRRGQLVDEAIGERSTSNLCVADNGGRWRRPDRVKRLENAKRRGFRCLSGTDPLPIDGEHRRVGSFGARMEAAVDTTTTASELLHALTRNDIAPAGSRVPMLRFLRNQLALRLA